MCCNEIISPIIHPLKFPRALIRLLVGAVTIFGAEMACAQETIRIGFSAPVTGPFAVYGKQMQSALKLFIERNGSSVAGKKIEVIVRDDAGVPDQADGSNATGTFDTKDVGTDKTVTVSGLVLTGADAGNYILTPPTTTANITPATADRHRHHGQRQGVRRHHRRDARYHRRHAGGRGRRATT